MAVVGPPTLFGWAREQASVSRARLRAPFTELRPSWRPSSSSSVMRSEPWPYRLPLQVSGRIPLRRLRPVKELKPSWNEKGTMKVRASVKPICDKCKVIHRRGVVRASSAGMGRNSARANNQGSGERIPDLLIHAAPPGEFAEVKACDEPGGDSNQVSRITINPLLDGRSAPTEHTMWHVLPASTCHLISRLASRSRTSMALAPRRRSSTRPALTPTLQGQQATLDETSSAVVTSRRAGRRG